MVAPVTGMSASPTSRPFVSVMMTFCAITGCTASAKPDATLETRKPRRENGTAGTRLSKSERSFMVVLSSYGAGYGINRSSILRSVVYLEYGGYRTPGSMRAPWYITPRALVNASNPQRPWYFPIPELPTPPNGSSGTSGWIVQSLIAASPDSVAATIRSATSRSSANTYSPSGRGRLLTQAMTASTEADLEARQDRAEHFLGEQCLERFQPRLAPRRGTDVSGQEVLALTRDQRGVVGIAHGHRSFVWRDSGAHPSLSRSGIFASCSNRALRFLAYTQTTIAPRATSSRMP